MLRGYDAWKLATPLRYEDDPPDDETDGDDTDEWEDADQAEE